MELHRLTDDVSVAAQISVDDVSAIKAAGFRSLVCHRPDGEVPDQPAFDDIAFAARAAGLEVRYQPVVSGRMVAADASEFGRLMEHLPKPILAYCRTGTRCTALWALAEVKSRSVADILNIAQAAGYDMAAVMSRMADEMRKSK